MIQRFVQKFIKSAKNLTTVKGIALMGVLLGITVVLKAYIKVDIGMWRLSLTFIPLAVAGIVLGPVPAFIIGAAGDVLGYVLAPTGGGYFPGFSLSMALIGLIYGLFLFSIGHYPDAREKHCPKLLGKGIAAVYDSLGLRDKRTRAVFLRTIFAELTATIFISCLLNTVFIRITTGALADIEVVLRTIGNAVMCPIKIAVILALYKTVSKTNAVREFEADWEKVPENNA